MKENSGRQLGKVNWGQRVDNLECQTKKNYNTLKTEEKHLRFS